MRSRVIKVPNNHRHARGRLSYFAHAVGIICSQTEYAAKLRNIMTIKSIFITSVLMLLAFSVFADKTCRKDSFGTTRCSDGTTYRTDSFGTTRDNKGNSWKTDSFGTTRGSDGSTYRTDSFGTTRDNKGNSWKTDSFGTTRGSDGTNCRKDSFGTIRCD